MERRITIDPITRLEGHGKIEIFLNDKGDVENAYLQIPELRGSSSSAWGARPRRCRVSPSASAASAPRPPHGLHQGHRRRLQSGPAESAKKLRDLFYSIFMLEDHTLHFYYLGGPDFIVGPTPQGRTEYFGSAGQGGAGDWREGHQDPARTADLMSIMAARWSIPSWACPAA